MQDPIPVPPTISGHVVAVPYPGRRHINPMMNLCKLLLYKNTNLHITFVVTEEWLGLIGSDSKPDNFRFASIPNVIPSEHDRANDYVTFFEAVMTNMEAPFDHQAIGSNHGQNVCCPQNQRDHYQNKDQPLDCKLIVEYWKVGWRVKTQVEVKQDTLIRKDEIASLVKNFMDLESDEGRDMRKRARELQLLCHRAIASGGSTDSDISAFLRHILRGAKPE
ncbi:UDP-glycosyltransferase 87A2-like [Abrus precatorius]|uniref:UDP-glycosyltransferase 87A2-like n=1 Tax=Abrus precatorius TaxID=3816 RepID=A0A8B8MIA0_ABRPR|nr:UDP-glycosyltransferase 87A2-like [Abrus precatorius]